MVQVSLAFTQFVLIKIAKQVVTPILLSFATVNKFTRFLPLPPFVILVGSFGRNHEQRLLAWSFKFA